MGLNDIGDMMDTAVVTLYDPRTAASLQNADGSEMTVTVYSPYSEQYRAVERKIQNRRLTRAARAGRAAALTAEQLEAEEMERLVESVQDWNLTDDTEPLPFSKEAARNLFMQRPWVRDQVQAAQMDMQAFLSNSAKT